MLTGILTVNKTEVSSEKGNGAGEGAGAQV